jgi:hypothetical protein
MTCKKEHFVAAISEEEYKRKSPHEGRTLLLVEDILGDESLFSALLLK